MPLLQSWAEKLKQSKEILVTSFGRSSFIEYDKD